MKKMLTRILIASMVIACFAAGIVVFRAVKENRELKEVSYKVPENRRSAVRETNSPTEQSTWPTAEVTGGPTVLPQEEDVQDNDTQVENDGEENADEMISFHPHAIKSTKPSKYIQMTQINVNGKTLTSNKKYHTKKKISFEQGKNYTTAEGILSFRGNNFRDTPVFGTADMKKNKLKADWTYQTGKLTSQGKTWTGSGWTGQPLVVKWPKATKKIMNMYSWAKKDDSLVEVIYACLDGHIYFLDMKTGKQTRDTLNIGYTFKGAGALDPRGYPIMYVGSGYNSSKGKSKVFVISLVDGSVLYTFGDNDPFSLRGSLSFFDSSALVDKETDTLIYPGESGILYLIHLGTKYDEEKGTLSIDPDRIVKWHYKGIRSSTSKYWLGMEDSAVVYKGYLYIQDNGGHFMCLNLNTLRLVWVQDCLDDSNGSPVMSIENGKAYLYASTSFHLGWRSSTTAPIPIWKIDAETGKIIWKTEYDCRSVSDLSGGVQSTIAVGKNNLSDNIYVTVSRTGGLGNGVLTCLNKKTGKVKWEHKAAYAWSSPICVYDQNGHGKVLYATSTGMMYLLNGKNGKVHDELRVSGSCIEASPVAYNNRLVIGTRGCQICGIKLK